RSAQIHRVTRIGRNNGGLHTGETRAGAARVSTDRATDESHRGGTGRRDPDDQEECEEPSDGCSDSHDSLVRPHVGLPSLPQRWVFGKATGPSFHTTSQTRTATR